MQVTSTLVMWQSFCNLRKIIPVVVDCYKVSLSTHFLIITKSLMAVKAITTSALFSFRSETKDLAQGIKLTDERENGTEQS